MAKQKDSSELEHLRGELRKLKSENRNLKKQLSRYEKRVRNYENTIGEREEEELEAITPQFEQETHRCPNCQAKIEPAHLGVRILLRCQCGYHRSVKVQG